MFVRSPAFENGDQIPSEYGCHGSDVSIPLIFENVPEGTRSLALIMDDPDAPAGLFVHWVAYNIPSDLQGLPENIPGAPRCWLTASDRVSTILAPLDTAARVLLTGLTDISSNFTCWMFLLP